MFNHSMMSSGAQSGEDISYSVGSGAGGANG